MIELTATAALLALLTSAAFITYARTWRHWALRQNAQQLYLAARYARVRAIETRRDCQLVIDSENKRYYIMQQSEEVDSTAPAETSGVVSNVWHRPGTLDDAVSFETLLIARVDSDGQGGTAVTFRPDGSADAATVQVGNGERSFTVQISPATARATLVDGPAQTYEPDQIDLDSE